MNNCPPKQVNNVVNAVGPNINENLHNQTMGKAELILGIDSNDMDIEIGLSDRNVVLNKEENESSENKSGCTGLHKIGPKAWKWKRWARDGVETTVGPGTKTQLGKRSALDSKINVQQDLKFVKGNADTCSTFEDISACRTRSACRSTVAMNTLVWNVRGLGSNRAFQVLLRVKRDYNPDIMFLMETKVNHFRIENLRIKLGYSGKLVIDSMGTCGCLCLMWSSSVDVSLLSYSLFILILKLLLTGISNGDLPIFHGHPVVS